MLAMACHDDSAINIILVVIILILKVVKIRVGNEKIKIKPNAE